MTDIKISEFPVLASPDDSDYLPVVDDSLVIPSPTTANKKLSWANIKAVLKIYFDGLYAILAHSHTGTSDSPKLSQANTHESVDSDTSASSIHHTLGISATQSSAGNHTHSQYGAAIPIVTSDPASPVDGELWLLRSGASTTTIGAPIGLLLSLTYASVISQSNPLQLGVMDVSTKRHMTFS